MLIKELSAIGSPLGDQQLALLKQITAELSPQQSAWLSGYLWGLSQIHAPESGQLPASSVNSRPSGKLTIIYASQTGNAKGVAEVIECQANSQGIPVELFSAGDYKAKNLAKETHLIIVASTNGEGEPPDDAIELHEFLQSKKAPKLNSLKYGVLALGDSGYEFFCQTGKDFDSYLSKLGAEPFIDRIDCDVDYDADAAGWREAALKKVAESLNTTQVITQEQSGRSVSDTYTKQSPYTATLLTNQKITGRHSTKDVRHIEIDLEGSGLTYKPGDALGVWYQNDPDLADAILSRVGLSGEEPVSVDGESLSVREALIYKYEITAANPQLIIQYAGLSGSKRLEKLVGDKDKLRKYAVATQIVDVLAEKKTTLDTEQLTGLLRRLTPRLYSIASSQEEVGEEVHLTVGVVEYFQGEESRTGGASGYLSQRLEEGEPVAVFVESNAHFKLPEDDNAPVIMIGPGTGIAPFRSFIQERDNRSAPGKNWLLFGDRTFTEDFLYQVEWQKYFKSGVLTRMDLAFSRDQKEKIYVQDKLKEHAAEIWNWLRNGAYLYVCGDAGRMAKDVNEALIAIAEQQGGKSREQAEEFVNQLRKDKRYQKDVY